MFCFCFWFAPLFFGKKTGFRLVILPKIAKLSGFPLEPLTFSCFPTKIKNISNIRLNNRILMVFSGFHSFLQQLCINVLHFFATPFWLGGLSFEAVVLVFLLRVLGFMPLFRTPTLPLRNVALDWTY